MPEVAQRRPAPSQPPGETDAVRAFHLIRSDIISGALAPDTKLKMRELKTRYGFGASPLREALSQLAAQGFVAQMSQRGFRVPPLEAAHLDDITRSRQLIEGEAFRLAIEAGDAEWEARIVSAFHVLERETRRLMRQRLPLDDAYEEAHSRFHRALVDACPLPSLKAFSELLYIQGTRYRMLMSQSLSANAKLLAVHENLKTLALARRADDAVAALTAHIEVPADMLLKKLDARRASAPRLKLAHPVTTRTNQRRKTA